MRHNSETTGSLGASDSTFHVSLGSRSIRNRNHHIPKSQTAAEDSVDSVNRPVLSEASLAFVSRRIAEAKTSDTARWIDSHIRDGRRYRPPRGRRIH